MDDVAFNSVTPLIPTSDVGVSEDTDEDSYVAIDVDNPSLVYVILSAEISYEEEEELISSRVFEALGGYAPTFGVVGAVIGLIQVMQDLQDLDAVGVGIAQAVGELA